MDMPAGLKGLLGIIGLAAAKTQGPQIDTAHQQLISRAPSYTDYVTNRYASGFRDPIDEDVFNSMRKPQGLRAAATQPPQPQ